MHRDAGRVNLGVAGIAEVSALTVGTPRGGGIAAVIDGRARGIVTRDMVTGKIEEWFGDAVVLATGG
jgi:hypothetical protein